MNRPQRWIASLTFASLMALAPFAGAQEEGATPAPATESARPRFGAEFEFAGLGNRIASFESMPFENYEKILRVVVEANGGNPADIKKVEWTVPHPSGEGERTLFRAEWTDSKGKSWHLEPEYVATNGLDGYELVTPPMTDSAKLREILDKVRSSGLVREGLKSGVHIHVDAGKLVSPTGDATALINLINMHENNEPLLRRLLNPVRGGGTINRFATPLYLSHSKLLNEINALEPGERTIENLERLFKANTANEMRARGITELDATTWKSMWKYNSLNLKNLLNINEVLPAGEINTVEFRMNDLQDGRTHQLEIELYRSMVERAAKLAAEGKVVRYTRPANFAVPEGVDPGRLLTPSDPAEAGREVREMLESFGLEASEYERLIEKNVQPRELLTEREVEKRVEELTRGRVEARGEAFTYGFELEGRGAGFAEISRPTDAEVNARWDAMSSADKRAYYESKVGENHRAVKDYFKLDTAKFPYLDGTMKVEGSGNWEIRSTVYESPGGATDDMRAVKRLVGKSAKGFHLHMRDNAPNWEYFNENGGKFADFIRRAGNWVWFKRVLSLRTDVSLKSWSNAPFTPETLNGIARMQPSNYARHTLRVGKNVMGGTNNLDIEIRGLGLDVNSIETLAKITTENLRSNNFGSWKYDAVVLPHGGGHGDAPAELKLVNHLEEYLKTVEGKEMTPEMRIITEGLQKKYADLSGKSTRALPSNLGMPLQPWEKLGSIDEPMRRSLKFAKEDYLRSVRATANKVASGGYGFDINTANEASLRETLGLNGAEAKRFVEMRRASSIEYGNGGSYSSGRGVNELLTAMAKHASPGVDLNEFNLKTVSEAKLRNAGLDATTVREMLKVRKAVNDKLGGELTKLDYNAIERSMRAKVKKWVETTNIERAMFRSLMTNPQTEAVETTAARPGTETEGFAGRRTAGPNAGENLKMSTGEVTEVFNAIREESARSAAGREGVSAAERTANAERVLSAKVEIISSNEMIMEYSRASNAVRVSTATLNEIHSRSLTRAPEARRGFRRAAAGIMFGHELAHAGGIKAERIADMEGVAAAKRARGVGEIDGVSNPITEATVKDVVRVFENPMGAGLGANALYRLRNLARYGTVSGREGALNRATRGEADPMSRFRRVDGTVSWGKATASGTFKATAGVSHFALALFLKEMAVVVKTGDRARIEEFFEFLTTTDFFKTYALFSAGAAGANVLYGRYIDKFIKPRFVSGVLRSNLVLATGMAIADIGMGHFNGKAFAINVAGLGLSSAAVKAGVSSIKWMVNLKRADSAGKLIRAGNGIRRLAKVGGWFYTAAETAVVLYFGDEISKAINGYLDERAARNAVADASVDFYKKLNDSNLSAAEFTEALEEFDRTHVDYRNYLYKPLLADDTTYYARLNKATTKAKRLSDKRDAMQARLEANPAIKAAYIKRFGSVEKYLDSLTADDEKAIDDDVSMYMASYNNARETHLAEVYTDNKRGTKYLDPAKTAWLAGGAKPGAPGDPYAGRSDALARWGRDRAVSDVRDDFYDISGNRLEAYDDELAALKAARAAVSGNAERTAILDEMIANVSKIKLMDSKFVLEAKSEGITGAMERGRR